MPENVVNTVAEETTKAIVDNGISKTGWFGIGVLVGAAALKGFQIVKSKISNKAYSEFDDDDDEDIEIETTVNPTETAENK